MRRMFRRGCPARRAVRVPVGLGSYCAAVVLVLTACDDVPSVAAFEPTTDPARLFVAVTLDHSAVNLSTYAPYDTIRLTATPRNALGEPLSGLPAPTFYSSDTLRVTVTPDGFVRARQPVKNVQVIAEIVDENNVRHADTAYVNVTSLESPPLPVKLEVTRERVDWPIMELRAEGFGTYFVGWYITGGGADPSGGRPIVRVYDERGDTIPGLAIELQSLDEQIIQMMRGDASSYYYSATGRFGPVRIVGRTMAYGVALADTAEFVVTAPSVNEVIINEGPGGELRLWPHEVVISPNGYVFWTNRTETPVDITFDDPTHVAEISWACELFGGIMCGGGNIPPFDLSTGLVVTPLLPPFATVGRQFLAPGVYTYRSTLTGHVGRVVVIEGATR